MVLSKLGKEILKDIQMTLAELRHKDLLRDENGVTQKTLRGNLCELSFPKSANASSVMYDKSATCSYIMDMLLLEHEYTVLLFDKSIIQAEFILNGDVVEKERLVFIKKHNKMWDTKEIQKFDMLDEDWFSEEFGVPIMIRIDYDPSSHRECDHAVSHLTLSNHESCRIPVKDAVSFSDFVRFVLLHFYNIVLTKVEYKICGDGALTSNEKKMIHLTWN